MGDAFRTTTAAEASDTRESEAHILRQFAREISSSTECELEKEAVLSACKRAKHCRHAALTTVLEDMCASPYDLARMSANAMQQLVGIACVVLLCCMLHAFFLLTEKFIMEKVIKKKQPAQE